AFAGFTLPAALAMIALALTSNDLIRQFGDGWLHGLKLAAAAVVLQAVVQMARSLAVGPVRAGLALGAGLGLVMAQGAPAQVAVILAGGLFGILMLRGETAAPPPDLDTPVVDIGSALMALGLFVLLLVGLPVLAVALQNPGLGLASVFYRTGSLVFGGGHVVLPLLEREVVTTGWMNRDNFLAGYGVMQALPGPLFSFAGFVGAAQTYGPRGVVGGLIALFAIFLPSLLLITAALPFWDRLKREGWARGFMAGVGATVVGVLAATLWDPVIIETIEQPADWALLGAAFVFLYVAKLPPWLVVVGFALATGLLLG
ncbi:MAG: chromate transporter, partial [Phenylobacterium sp.]|nr:chromate transporter [Phenylobacterium sp.]